MTKIDEYNLAASCFNKAKDNELMFILLERDLATPDTIRFWVKKRFDLGLNESIDTQIKEASMLANTIEDNQLKRKAKTVCVHGTSVLQDCRYCRASMETLPGYKNTNRIVQG
jgi:hypothetical protein